MSIASYLVQTTQAPRGLGVNLNSIRNGGMRIGEMERDALMNSAFIRSHSIFIKHFDMMEIDEDVDNIMEVESDKINMTKLQTRQPPKGRANHGGKRAGEIERDADQLS